MQSRYAPCPAKSANNADRTHFHPLCFPYRRTLSAVAGSTRDPWPLQRICIPHLRALETSLSAARAGASGAGDARAHHQRYWRASGRVRPCRCAPRRECGSLGTTQWCSPRSYRHVMLLAQSKVGQPNLFFLCCRRQAPLCYSPRGATVCGPEHGAGDPGHRHQGAERLCHSTAADVVRPWLCVGSLCYCYGSAAELAEQCRSCTGLPSRALQHAEAPLDGRAAHCCFLTGGGPAGALPARRQDRLVWGRWRGQDSAHHGADQQRCQGAWCGGRTLGLVISAHFGAGSLYTSP